MPWFVVILFVVLAIVAYYFWRSQNERLRAPSSEDEMSQTFDFPEQAGAVALNRRTLRIIAPTQIVRGKKTKNTRRIGAPAGYRSLETAARKRNRRTARARCQSDGSGTRHWRCLDRV